MKSLGLKIIENEINHYKKLSDDKDVQIEKLNKQVNYLVKELKEKEIQMEKLIKKCVDLSMEKLEKDKKPQTKETSYVGYMTLDL